MSQLTGLSNFVLIWFGQMVSAVGSRLSTFALGIWVFQTTGSATQFALIFVAMAVPALLVSPFAGALVDRWDRRKTMIACDLVSAISMILLAALLATDYLSIWHIYVGVGLSSIANAFHSPAYASSIPLLVSTEKLSRVNGMVQMSFAAAQIIAPLFAGILLSVFDLYGVLVIDAITFTAAVFALVFARIPKPEKVDNEAPEDLLKEVAEGLRYVRHSPALVGLLTVFGVNNFLFGIASIAITPLILAFSTPTMLGIQFSIGGAGLLLGGLIMASSGGPKQLIHGVLGTSIIAGVALAAHGLWPSFSLIAIAGFILFLMIPIIGASNDSIWQSKVPIELQGRCFAIQRVLSQSAMPIGYAIAGPMMALVFEPLLNTDGLLVDSLGLLIGVGEGRGTGFMFILLGLFMASVALFAYSIPAIRKVDAMPDRIITKSNEKTDVNERLPLSFSNQLNTQE